MSTQESAELIALRGLLLVVVEVQNLMRAGKQKANGAAHFGSREAYGAAAMHTLDGINDLIESAPTAELVQLAKAALQTVGTAKVRVSVEALRALFTAGASHLPIDEPYNGYLREVCALLDEHRETVQAVPADKAGIHS